MKPTAKEYAELLKALKSEYGIDNAEERIAILQECAKDLRMERFREEREKRKEDIEKTWRDEPATESQQLLITKLGGEFKPGITKGEASKLIEELKAKKKTNIGG